MEHRRRAGKLSSLPGLVLFYDMNGTTPPTPGG